MKVGKPTLTACVLTFTLMCTAFPNAAMASKPIKFSPATHSLSRLEVDQKMLAADMQRLRRHLRHGASQTQIALERDQIHRDWQNIIAERGSKPAELSSRVATFHSSWWFSSPWHTKKSEAQTRALGQESRRATRTSITIPNSAIGDDDRNGRRALHSLTLSLRSVSIALRAQS